MLTGLYRHCTFSLTSLLISNIFDVTSLVHNQKTLKSIAVVSLNPHPSADDISGYQQWIQDSPENCLTVCHLCRYARSVLCDWLIPHTFTAVYQKHIS